MNFGRKMMKAGVAAVAAIATLGAGGVVASTAFAGGGGGNLFLGNPEHLRQYALRQLAFASDDFENLGLQLLHLGGSRIQLRLGLLL